MMCSTSGMKTNVVCKLSIVNCFSGNNLLLIFSSKGNSKMGPILHKILYSVSHSVGNWLEKSNR